MILIYLAVFNTFVFVQSAFLASTRFLYNLVSLIARHKPRLTDILFHVQTADSDTTPPKCCSCPILTAGRHVRILALESLNSANKERRITPTKTQHRHGVFWINIRPIRWVRAKYHFRSLSVYKERRFFQCMTLSSPLLCRNTSVKDSKKLRFVKSCCNQVRLSSNHNRLVTLEYFPALCMSCHGVHVCHPLHGLKVYTCMTMDECFYPDWAWHII